jgi:hypothetical protein
VRANMLFLSNAHSGQCREGNLQLNGCDAVVDLDLSLYVHLGGPRDFGSFSTAWLPLKNRVFSVYHGKGHNSSQS